ncbi:MAG TPA: DUF4173 domain-containing protein [Pyrinomonadaceae bacterium]|nr:DUF4173 domain-containing protein [Pyrinomonadaceae bacterium]
MNDKTRTGLEILQSAVLLGVLGDVLLRAAPWGINAFLFIGALVAAMTMLFLRRKQEIWNSQMFALNGALLFFAAMFIWRDSKELRAFDFLMILTILAILTLPAVQIKTRLAGLIHYGIAGIWSGVNAMFSPLVLIFSDIEWKTLPQTGWTKHLIAILRGLAIATPILLIFGGLFVAADAVFQGIVERTLNINIDVLVSHVFMIGVFSWLTAGYLRGSLFGLSASDELKNEHVKDEIKPQVLSVTDISDDQTQKTEEPKIEEKSWTWQNFDNSVMPQFFTLGAIETSIVLGLINLLFLSFVIVQIPYLFGGFELVQNTPDFKLAEYARRGFGELVAVAALVLPILLFSHWLLRKDSPINEKIYRVLAGIQIVLLFVIMASAMQRLFILTGNLGYGLTTIRFYPMAFMIWLAIVFVWFAVTVLRGNRQYFAWGALWSAIFVLGTLHVVNPDAYIVKTNIRLMNEGRQFDAFYNSELSDDAVPVLLENLQTMSFENQCTVKWKLSNRLTETANESDVRSWNYARWKARNGMNAFSEGFDTTNCPHQTKRYSNLNEDF